LFLTLFNHRVQNIEGLIKKLKENEVTVLDEIEEYDYGKFVHIMDPEGNKIELWEPVDSVFTKMGGGRNHQIRAITVNLFPPATSLTWYGIAENYF